MLEIIAAEMPEMDWQSDQQGWIELQPCPLWSHDQNPKVHDHCKLVSSQARFLLPSPFNSHHQGHGSAVSSSTAAGDPISTDHQPFASSLGWIKSLETGTDGINAAEGAFQHHSPSHVDSSPVAEAPVAVNPPETFGAPFFPAPYCHPSSNTDSTIRSSCASQVTSASVTPLAGRTQARSSANPGSTNVKVALTKNNSTTKRTIRKSKSSPAHSKIEKEKLQESQTDFSNPSLGEHRANVRQWHNRVGKRYRDKLSGKFESLQAALHLYMATEDNAEDLNSAPSTHGGRVLNKAGLLDTARARIAALLSQRQALLAEMEALRRQSQA